MEFTSLWFLFYLTLVAMVYRKISVGLRAPLLVVASYTFYCSLGTGPALLLAAATLTAYLGGLALHSAKSETIKQAIMVALVTGLAGLLILFKSVRFLPGVMRELALPLGISYYIFKLISYVVNIYWGSAAPERRLMPFAAYIAFFPQIVAGPIQRSEDFLPQLQSTPPVPLSTAMYGVQRILLGYFKKFVVADGLAVFVNLVYGHLYDSGTPVILGFYIFPLQLYADFSGLTDIAIGAALLLGIQSPENFNAPFSAANPSDFWRRWHITLTSWLTDYVFTPLRMWTRALGNRGLVFSLWINMILIGLWHGFRWNMVVFGALHALYLSVDALTLPTRKRYYKTHPGANRLTTWIGPVVVFHLVAISFVFFRGQTLADGFYILGHLGKAIGAPSAAFLGSLQESNRTVMIGFAGVLLASIADYLRRHSRQGDWLTTLPRWGRWSAYSCTAATLVIMILLVLGLDVVHNPFVYQVF